MADPIYTTQLQAGLGMIDETNVLLDLWGPGMSSTQLYQTALDSGSFPTMSARRLRNVVAECFSPRLMAGQSEPAAQIKLLRPIISSGEFQQLLFIYACRANAVLGGFVREVYWPAYTAGRDSLSTEDARAFIVAANQEGRTTKPWSETTVRRVAAYVAGACGDFGLLEPGTKRVRAIHPYRIEPHVALYLAYDLHFSGLGDNSVLAHRDWSLFGMDRTDVLDQMKQLALRGAVTVQAGGDAVRIDWRCKNFEEVRDAIARH